MHEPSLNLGLFLLSVYQELGTCYHPYSLDRDVYNEEGIELALPKGTVRRGY